jgi:hypothetical protein
MGNEVDVELLVAASKRGLSLAGGASPLAAYSSS